MDQFRPFANEPQKEYIFKPKASSFGFIEQEGTSKSFIDKHKPTSIKDILRNNENIKIIKKWIQDRMENKADYPFILLVGETGIGKSEMLRVCFTECNCNVIEYDEDIRKKTFESLKESITLSSIERLLTGNDIKRNGIIIDNFQETLQGSQRQELIKILKTQPTSPVIFISHTYTNISSLIKAKGLILYYEKPELEDFIKLGTKICKHENIKISRSALEHIIYSSRYDLRSFINNLGMIQIGKNNKITNTDVKAVNFKKDLVLDVQNTFTVLLQRKMSFTDRSRFTSLHTSMVLQENYIDLANHHKSSIQELSEMADLCCESDIMKTHMIKNQNWENTIMVNTIGTMGPLNVLNYKSPEFKIKIPNRNTSVPKGITFNLSLVDLMYIIKNIIKPTDENIKESGYQFYTVMIENHIELDMALKLFNMAYKDWLSKDIRRINTKLKKKWLELIE